MTSCPGGSGRGSPSSGDRCARCRSRSSPCSRSSRAGRAATMSSALRSAAYSAIAVAISSGLTCIGLRRACLDVFGYPVGDEVADRLTGAHAAADHRRRDADPSASGRTAPARLPAATSSASEPHRERYRAARRSPASPATAPAPAPANAEGRRQCRRRRSGSARCSALSRSAPSGYRPCTTVRRGAARGRTRSKRSSSATASRHSSSRWCAPGSSLDRLVRRDPGRDEHHRVERELQVRLLGAHEVTKMWRVERAAEDSDAHGAQGEVSARM